MVGGESATEIRIRDGGVIDAVRSASLLYRCLTAAPHIFPIAVADSYCQHLNPSMLRSFLENGGHLLVAERDERLVGFSCGVPDSLASGFGTYYGAWIAVDPTLRQQQVGRRLLRANEARARARGCHKYYGLVQADNEPAIRFFTQAGHVSEGVLRHHWNNRDFHFMARMLDDVAGS
jgi:ribosomal protein S18 acetylase RimI-like enzyme